MRKLIYAAVLGFVFLPISLQAGPLLSPSEIQFGQTYPLRDSVALTLTRAKYTVARVNIGAASYFPQAGEKLLVLHFRIQNLTKDSLAFDAGTIPFSVVDAAGATHKSVQDVGVEATHQTAEFDLKPGEVKDDLYTVLITSATGADKTLIVEAGREGIEEESLRCSLSGQVTPLDALKSVPAAGGVFYPLALLDARLDTTAYTSLPLGGIRPDEEQRYFTTTFTVLNKSAGKHGVSGMNFVPILRDTQGKSIEYNQIILKPAEDVSGDAVLSPDAEMSVRFFWTLPKSARAQSLSLAEGQSRAYVFDVSGTKL